MAITIIKVRPGDGMTYGVKLQDRHQDIVNEMIMLREHKNAVRSNRSFSTSRTVTPLQRPKYINQRTIKRLPLSNEVPHLAAKFHSVAVSKAEFDLIATHKQKYILTANNACSVNDTIRISCGNREILAFIMSVGRVDNKSVLSLAVWSIKGFLI